MKKANSNQTANSQYHVPNLERALKIMELLADHTEGLTATQITEFLNFPRNSVFRITTTLLDHGYLSREEGTKVFQLSQKLLTMGYSALSEQNLVEKSIGVMRSLRDRFKETVPLGILHGEVGLVIEEVPGTYPFRFVLEPGKTFHLHTSAPGKALVAYLPDEEREELIQQIDFKIFNERTITDTNTYRLVLEEVRQLGYAIDHAEETEGMYCIGAPIFNRQGIPVAAIWLTGPSSRIREEDFDLIGIEVRRHADRISRNLGFGISGNIEKTRE